jgi:RNA polymerase sigma-70 factor (ECF subfamily)
MEAPRLIGGLVRYVRDLDVAEDLAQDALLMALERWPESGVPDNAGAWLMTTAKNRAIDLARKRTTAAKHQSELARVQEDRTEPTETGGVGDDVLRLMLIACHPVLSQDARTALTLRLIGGLSTLEIARTFLTTEATIAQRIVRAKRTLAEARVPFAVPGSADLAARIPAVLDVIYFLFHEGYTAATGGHWMRPALCAEAMRLARLLAGMVPDHAEAHGLLALMELHASRMKARQGPDGEPILLLDQNRAAWDRLLIHRGLAALARAESLAQPLGPYTLQAAIAACHARARTPEATDWKRIVALYDALAALTGSPVVELNRAVAISMAFGPAEALDLVEEIAEDPAVRNYYLVPAVRADLLQKMGRSAEAKADFERAACLTMNLRERAQLRGRAAACWAENVGQPGQERAGNERSRQEKNGMGQAADWEE